MCSSNTCNVRVNHSNWSELLTSVLVFYISCISYSSCNDFENNIFLAPYLCENQTTSCAHQVSNFKPCLGGPIVGCISPLNLISLGPIPT